MEAEILRSMNSNQPELGVHAAFRHSRVSQKFRLLPGIKRLGTGSFGVVLEAKRIVCKRVGPELADDIPEECERVAVKIELKSDSSLR